MFVFAHNRLQEMLVLWQTLPTPNNSQGQLQKNLLRLLAFLTVPSFSVFPSTGTPAFGMLCSSHHIIQSSHVFLASQCWCYHAISRPWHPCSEMLPAQALFFDQLFFFCIPLFCIFWPFHLRPASFRTNLWFPESVICERKNATSGFFVVRWSLSANSLAILMLCFCVLGSGQHLTPPALTLRAQKTTSFGGWDLENCVDCVDLKKRTSKFHERRGFQMYQDNIHSSKSHFKQIFAILRLCTLAVTVVKFQCTEKKTWTISCISRAISCIYFTLKFTSMKIFLFYPFVQIFQLP